MLPGKTKANPVAADGIQTVKTLKRYLCSLAWDPENRALYPEMCEICVAQCRYGQRLLVLMPERKNHQ